MRGVRKGNPPANVSPAKQQPATLEHGKQVLLQKLPASKDGTAASHLARACFNAMDKKKLRAALFSEQHHLCVYCEERVREREPALSIEHWDPLSEFPGEALSWDDLYASCDRKTTCDGARKNKPFLLQPAAPAPPWPATPGPTLKRPAHVDYEHSVGFTSLGEMGVRASSPLLPAEQDALRIAIQGGSIGGQTYPAILNLNHRTLVAARAVAMEEELRRWKRDQARMHLVAADRFARASALLAAPERVPFVSARVAVVTRTFLP